MDALGIERKRWIALKGRTGRYIQPPSLDRRATTFL